MVVMDEPGRDRSPTAWSPIGTAIRLAVLAALYFALAQLGLEFELSESVASPVWPPAGLAVVPAVGEAALGGWLVARAGGARAFASLGGVLRFAAATAAGALVGATAGALALVLSNTVPSSAAGQVWWTWFFGDAAGAFVVAPV